MEPSRACETFGAAGASHPAEAHTGEGLSHPLSGFLNGLPGDVEAAGI